MNRSLLRSILSFSLVVSPTLLALGTPGEALAAQGDGAIKGVVTNGATGEGVADALIILQCNCLTEPRETSTNAAGVYALGGLPAGLYTVQMLVGSQNKSKQITVGRGQSMRVNFDANPKSTKTIEIVVEASSVGNDTSSGTKVTMRDVAKMPVGGSESRDFTDVVAMAPTAGKDAAGYTLAGTTGAETRYTLDGGSLNDPSMGTVGVQIVQEFIESVEIKESGYGAEYGGASGGQVIATRVSGSNDFRGTARITVQPRLAEPRIITSTDESLRVTQVQDIQGQAVFLLTGPIIKDRLFFSVYLAPEATRYSLIQGFYHRVDRDGSGGFERCPYENGTNDCAEGQNYIMTEEFTDAKYATGRVALGWGVGLDWAINENHKLKLTLRGGPGWSRESYRLPFSSAAGFASNSGGVSTGATAIATGIIEDHFGWSTSNDMTATLRYQGRLAKGKTEIDAVLNYLRVGGEEAWKLDNPGLKDIVMTQESDEQGRNLFEFLDRENQVKRVANVETACNNLDLPGLACPTRTWLSGGLGQFSRDHAERLQAAAKVQHTFDAAGQHELKWGADFEWLRRTTRSEYSGKNEADFYTNCESKGWEGGGEWCYDPGKDRYLLRSNEISLRQQEEFPYDDDDRPDEIRQAKRNMIEAAVVEGRRRVNNKRLILVDSDQPEIRNSVGYGRAKIEQEDLRAMADALGRGARVDAYEATLSTLNYAAFVQDKWSILSNLHVSAGVRWEAQDMRDIMGTQRILIADNISPRVGMFYDWTDEGRSRLYASYGWFFNPLPLNLNSRVFGGNVRVDRTYRQTDCEGRDTATEDHGTQSRLVDGQPTEWCEDFASLGGTSGTNLGAVVPRLRGHFNRQFQIGYEQEIIDDLTLGFRWLHTDLGRAVEDVSTNGGNDFLIANPGVAVSEEDINAKKAECSEIDGELDNAEASNAPEDEKRPLARASQHCHFVATAYERVNELYEEPTRNFDAWTFQIKKNFGDNWMLVGSYTYSRLVGNYDGYVDTDTGTINIGASTQYDIPELVRNSFGPLSGNIPHKVNLDAFYQFDLKNAGRLTVGTSARFRSGAAINVKAANARYPTGFLTYLLPRGAGGELKPNYNINLSVAYAYTLPKDIALEITARLINVTNAGAIYSVDSAYSHRNARPIAGGDIEDLKHARSQSGAGQTEFFDPTILTPQGNFGVERAFQDPMSAQFDVKLSF